MVRASGEEEAAAVDADPCATKLAEDARCSGPRELFAKLARVVASVVRADATGWNYYHIGKALQQQREKAFAKTPICAHYLKTVCCCACSGSLLRLY